MRAGTNDWGQGGIIKGKDKWLRERGGGNNLGKGRMNEEERIIKGRKEWLKAGTNEWVGG